MSTEGRGIRSGDWYAFCDVCGRRFFGSTLRKRWDNLLVCDDDWDPRPEFTDLNATQDSRKPPIARPDVSNDSLDHPAYDPSTTNWYTVED